MSEDEWSEPPSPQPWLNRDAFNCPHCGAYAHQSWNDLKRLAGPQLFQWVEVQVLPGNAGDRERWRTARCIRCDQPSVWRDTRMLYPLARVGGASHPDMPAAVRELYTEAATVAAVSRRAGAALARATVERLIKVLDPGAPAGATLDKRIDRIRSRVSTPLGELLEVVRYLGNKMLHVEDQPGDLVVLALDDQEGPALVELLLAAANDLVAELITKPNTVAGLRDRLPEQVRAKLAGGASGGSGGGS